MTSSNPPRRLIFGTVAEDYDRYRPAYPDELFDLLLDRAAPDAVLDVGSGTGKLAAGFAARDLPGHAVEPNTAMATVLASNLPATWSIEISDFETCEAAGRSDWPLITCAQAWHWIDHEQGLGRSRELLAPGATLAICWNRPSFVDTPLRREMDEIYDRLAPNMDSSLRGRDVKPKGSERVLETVDAGQPPEGYREVEHVELFWEQRYDAAGWVGNIATHSNHLLLEPDLRSELLGEVGAAIDRHGGEFVLPYRIDLLLFTAT
ncbi:MAG: hypothetical protein U5K30_12260 [Acidimicrobiales bacterium]|nr:hypothetical protein [Acidimicrobiales bacterium]